MTNKNYDKKYKLLLISSTENRVLNQEMQPKMKNPTIDQYYLVDTHWCNIVTLHSTILY